VAENSVSETALSQSDWSGGTRPYGIGSKKLGMWLFIVSDSITFGALLIAYSYLRVASEAWPTPFPLWPSLANASLMTAILLGSSLTMVMAVDASKRGKISHVVRWVVCTMIGGILFDVLHLYEWSELIHEGVGLFSNPWGTPLFGAAFFTLTGLHMTHVTIGVIYLGVIAWGTARGKYTPEDVEVSGLYWHFVDLVWMFIFPLVYLMSTNLN
jgi:cytochrome c oxidase subunit 3